MADMDVEKILARRLFRSKRRVDRPARSSVLAVCGIAAGVVSLVVVLSVMGGFERSLQTRMLSVRPHIQWQPSGLSADEISSLQTEFDDLEKNLNVTRSKYVQGPAMALANETVTPADFLGLGEGGWSQLREKVIEGRLPEPEDLESVVIGFDLADDLALTLGSVLEVINPYETESLFIPMPVSRRYTVSGIVRTGLAEWDLKGVWANTAVTADFFGFPEEKVLFSWWLKDFGKIDSLADKLRAAAGPKQNIHTWKELNATIFNSMEIEQRSMFIILLFVIAVASLNITILLTMTVNDKKSAIGMLITLGLTPQGIRKVFSLHGLKLGLFGTLSGALLGVGISLFLKHVPVIKLPDVYYDQSLPVQLNYGWILTVTVASLVISYLAAYLPARKAAALDPIECLRTGR